MKKLIQKRATAISNSIEAYSCNCRCSCRCSACLCTAPLIQPSADILANLADSSSTGTAATTARNTAMSK